jgi:hypothetical protein
VIVKYCKALAKLRYSVTLLTEEPMEEESFGLVSTGVVDGLHWSICAWSRRSWATYSWERKRPEEVG